MAQYIRLALLTLAALSATIGPTLAAEATLRLRGSAQTFSGNLISFDGDAYVLETEMFGEVSLDAKRFECVSGACPEIIKGNAAKSDIAKSDAAVPPPQKNATAATQPAQIEPRSLFSRDEQLQLFRDFLEWRKSNLD